MKLLLATLIAMMSQIGFSAIDHTYYYVGKVHYTDLTGAGRVPVDEEFVLKKDLLPSRGVFVETATMRDRNGIMSDLTTTVHVTGNSVVAVSTDGSVTGVGQTKGPEWDFSYLELNFVVRATGTRIKNINYITPSSLIARKEISNSAGTPTLLWEADMKLISVDEYKARRKQLMGN